MPLCAEAERRFQKFVSVPPVTIDTRDDDQPNLFDTVTMDELIDNVMDVHRYFVKNGSGGDDFYNVITDGTSSYIHNLLYRFQELNLYYDDDDDPEIIALVDRAFDSLDAWFREVERLHDEVMKCRRPGIKNQLMGEQLYRQSAVPLPPNVAQTISEFSGAKDPKRVFLDAVKNKGVALPRPVESETEEALRLELAKPDPNQSKIAALRRELARKGGRRTRRTKRRRRQTKKLESI